MDIRRTLLEKIRRMPVIDAHEHLMPEKEQNSMPRDALTVFGQYTRLPMFASGLSEEDWARIHDPSLPLMTRWALAQPFIDKIKYTSFARAARLTLKHCWGASELTSENIGPLSERIAAENRPGIYQKVLRGDCKIVHVLNQNAPPPDDRRELEVYQNQELLQPVVALIDPEPPGNLTVNRIGGPDGMDSLDDYLEWAGQRLVRMAQGGGIGFKTCAFPYQLPDRRAAQQEFTVLKRTEERLPLVGSPGPLMSYIHDELLRAAVPLGLTVAVHTGFWGDFRLMDPTHMIPVLQRHPEIRFDLFHGGVPYVRGMGLIAVNFANTSVNLCWAHSINAAMTASALDEYIDQLGTDKIIGFGGDVRWMVEKVYGHLELARRNIASVLARRVGRGLMKLEEAERIAKLWLFDNPTRIYRLPVALD